MPVYRVKVRGTDSERIVRAASAAKARDHVVEAEALTADEVAAAAIAGQTFESASDGEGEAEPEPKGEMAKPE